MISRSLTTANTKRWGARLVVAAAAAAAAVTLVPAPAHAAGAACNFGRPTPAGITCTTDYSSGSKVTVIKSGTGRTLRAAFYDSWLHYSGDRILYYGSNSCSASTTDTDFKLAALPDGWDNKISSVEDFSGCDVNLFQDVDFGTGTGYVNYGERSSGGGKHLSYSRHNWASSFKIS
jgi:hypothetical protein